MVADQAKSVAIIGGGITGLVTARRLQEAGFAVRLFEKRAQVGGTITTTERDGWLVEGGPNAIEETPAVARLVKELGLQAQRAADGARAHQRFVLRAGHLVRVPFSPAELLTSPLFSLRARVRVGLEWFTRARVRTTDTSLANFIRAHFGREILDHGADPLSTEVYAGDPEKLSARYAFPRLWRFEQGFGSLLRGLRADAQTRRQHLESAGPNLLISFARGLQALPTAIAANLRPDCLRMSHAVQNIIPGRRWKIIASREDGVETSEFDAVVLTLPASGLAQLVFGTLGERPLASLEHQPHPPLSSLFLGFKRAQVAHALDGFGVLIPAVERRNILSLVFSSTIFPGRAPSGHVALTVFAGGARQPEVARLETSALVRQVMPQLRELLGVTGEPVFCHHTFWPKAVPQYNLGHERFLDPVARCEIAHPGLFVGGSIRDGISVPDCIQSGEALGARTAAYLQALKRLI